MEVRGATYVVVLILRPIPLYTFILVKRELSVDLVCHSMVAAMADGVVVLIAAVVAERRMFD